MKLYHFTCDHGAAGIGRFGMIRPNRNPQFRNCYLIWLTDLPNPDRESVGLTSHTLRCDRMEYRYVVETDNAVPYLEWIKANDHLLIDRKTLEEGRSPEHWFVSEVSVLGVRDRQWEKP